MTAQINQWNIRQRDIGFALLCLVSIPAVVIAQGASLAVFDTTGMDRYVPSEIIFIVIPALIMAIVPTLVGCRLYGSRRGAIVGAGVVVATLIAALFMVDFFILGASPP